MRALSRLTIVAGGRVLLFTVGTSVLIGQSERLSYTAEQALQGEVAYRQSCESCHGPHLDDGEFGPPLRGDAFMMSWGGKPADAFFTHLRTMPPSNPGSLGADAYARLFAYLLEQNGARPGATPLPSRTAALAEILMPTQSGAPAAVSAVSGRSTRDAGSSRPGRERCVARRRIKRGNLSLCPVACLSRSP